jgi:hypothetical protein
MHRDNWASYNKKAHTGANILYFSLFCLVFSGGVFLPSIQRHLSMAVFTRKYAYGYDWETGTIINSRKMNLKENLDYLC